MSNPIHKKDDGWYFSDELWVEEYGPYATEEKAREELDKYSASLGLENPEEQSSDSFPA